MLGPYEPHTLDHLSVKDDVDTCTNNYLKKKKRKKEISEFFSMNIIHIFLNINSCITFIDFHSDKLGS